jgi:hypothetical protein
MVGYNESFQEGCCLYDPLTHCMTKHHKAIINEHFPHGSHDDYQHVSIEHAFPSSIKLLVDESHLIVVYLMTLILGAPMGTFSRSSYGRSLGTYGPTHSTNPSYFMEVSCNLIYFDKAM